VSAVRVEVTGEWAGAVGGWRPAVDGAENQTCRSAAEASVFDDEAEAEAWLVSIGASPDIVGCRWALDEDIEYGSETMRSGVPLFRIVEVQS
jgi:hypothetical protein